MGSDRRNRSRSRSREKPRREREERGDRRERSRSRDRQRKNRSRSRERKERTERTERTGPRRDKAGGGGAGGAGNANMVPLGKEDGGYGLRNPGIKKEEGEEAPEKEGINLGLSGALTKDVNTFNGIVIKYSEPPEARVPKRRWRFYQFKGEKTLYPTFSIYLVWCSGDEVMPTLHIHRQSAYLIGRDRKVRPGSSLSTDLLISVILRFATSPWTIPAVASNTQPSNTD